MSSGVPQGSIIGPLLYTLYTSNLEKVVQNCKIHLYADDTQIYYSFRLEDFAVALNAINDDISNIIEWSKNHALSINSKKTSVLVFGPQKARLEVAQRLKVDFDGQQISTADSAKNLGLIYDSTLRFKLHVNNCIRLAYANLKMIYNSRYFLSKKLKIILCESLVLSRFNFSDVIYGPCIDATDARRIQTVQNACLRLIFGIRKRESVSHKLNEIGWLNMSDRRLLHSACLFHKIINNKAPQYLYKKLTFRTDVHNLNVRFRGRLTPPVHRTELYKRSFSYQITKIYNNLPTSIKSKSVPSFKRALKKKIITDKNVITTT